MQHDFEPILEIKKQYREIETSAPPFDKLQNDSDLEMETIAEHHEIKNVGSIMLSIIFTIISKAIDHSENQVPNSSNDEQKEVNHKVCLEESLSQTEDSFSDEYISLEPHNCQEGILVEEIVESITLILVERAMNTNTEKEFNTATDSYSPEIDGKEKPYTPNNVSNKSNLPGATCSLIVGNLESAQATLSCKKRPIKHDELHSF